MGSVKWTDDQLRAIEARGSSLLVSAAAGSGKTAVLVERLLRRITEERLDVTQFLIITYTKAAAHELRCKISDALYKKVAEQPGDRHIRRQLTLTDNARISTVHSFCMWVLKNYGNNPALAGGFRVLDETEGKLILDEVLSELIEEKYEQGEKSFIALAEYLSDARSDKQLFASVLELYSKSMSHPYPKKWLAEAACSYDVDGKRNICDTSWGKAAIKKAHETVQNDIARVCAALSDADSNAEASVVYHDYLTELRLSLEKILSDDWDELRANLERFEIGRMPSSRKLTDKSVKERISAQQKRIKSDIEMLCSEIVPLPAAPLIAEISKLSGYMRELAHLASELGDRFRREKLRRGTLDYSDLEHFAIELLVSEYDAESDTVTPSETGTEVSKSFCEILLDEFQDSNIIQDIIFRAVSQNEKNIVMVGDVKQSIYGFRLADPSIFMKKYKNFRRYEDAKGDEPRCITLAQNFRSRAEVLDASNSIFSRVMTEKLGGVDYTGDQLLVPRDNIPHAERKDMKCEFCLIDVDNPDERKAIEAEALFVAEKIHKLVSEGFEICDKEGNLRCAQYSDFAILLRAAGSCAEYYERALSKFGIPFASPRAGGLLEKSEVNAIIAYLSVIDNPTSDIPLLAALRSPLFAFSADDLCVIRQNGDGSLIYAMEALAKKSGETADKCRAFLTALSELRALSRGMSVGSLIWEVYNRTNALGMFGALPFGEERQRNLIELYKSAESFEGLGYFGLYRFVSHIAKLAERGGDIAAPAAYTANSVTVMTMHKSKGLEFPIVFIGSAMRGFNLEDTKRPVLIHPKLGVGLRYRDETVRAEYSTVIRDIIKRRIIEEQKSEEMRLMYVAMTRAREKLYIVASRKDAVKMIQKRCAENAYSELDSVNLTSRNDAQLWFMLPLIRTVTGKPILDYASCTNPFADGELEGMEAYIKPASELEYPVNEENATVSETEEEGFSEVEAMIGFKYGHVEATETPSKVTATGIGAAGNESRTPHRRRMPRPGFMREKSLTATEKGTALHMAMQFADFEKCKTTEDAKTELLRLRSEKYLSEKQYEAVDPEKLSGFVNSDIGCEMLSSDKICREFKFSVLLPADEMLCDNALRGEQVLLQGVMDMYFEAKGEITIVDFKTDRRRPEGDTLKKYAVQLQTYRRALFEMTGKKAKRLILYLVSLGQYIEVK